MWPNGLSGCGRIFRDSRGTFVVEFACSLGIFTFLIA